MPVEIKEACVYLILLDIFSFIEKLGSSVRMCMFFAYIQRSTNSVSVPPVFFWGGGWGWEVGVSSSFPIHSTQVVHLQVSLIQSFLFGH